MIKSCWHCLHGEHWACWGLCTCLVCAADDKDDCKVKDLPMVAA